MSPVTQQDILQPQVVPPTSNTVSAPAPTVLYPSSTGQVQFVSSTGAPIQVVYSPAGSTLMYPQLYYPDQHLQQPQQK